MTNRIVRPCPSSPWKWIRPVPKGLPSDNTSVPVPSEINMAAAACSGNRSQGDTLKRSSTMPTVTTSAKAESNEPLMGRIGSMSPTPKTTPRRHSQAAHDRHLAVMSLATARTVDQVDGYGDGT